MPRVLVVLIDAFRYDYLSDSLTPFLRSLAKQGFCAPLQPILGYSDAIRATIFTGTYPDVHGYWIKYSFRPENSPFNFLKNLKFFDHIPDNLAKRAFRFALSIMLGEAIALKHNCSAISADNIPFGIAPFFDATLRKDMISLGAFGNVPSLFDVLVKHDILFGLVSSMILRDKLGKRALKVLKRLRQNTQFIFVYLDHLDFAAHRYGISSRRFRCILRYIDALIEDIITTVEKRFDGEFLFIIFSDHGMAEVKKFINFEKMIFDKRFGKDYIFFLDSTMVRIWYLNEAVKEEIRERFSKLPYGSFLSQGERASLRISFNQRYYGDDVYLLKPGYSIFPDFMSWLKPRAMHAYHPNHRSQLGIFICSDGEAVRFNANQMFVKPVDIMPTILDILGIEPPSTCEGTSLYRRCLKVAT
ncbi:MAG: alkaline phosphatase family protein [Candidatus Bathyarchaeia archaeon]